MNFVLVSDVLQSIKEELFGPGWYCLAVAKIPSSNISRERFFFLLLDKKSSQTYIEEYVDYPKFFIKIETKEQQLWDDLFMFFYEKGFITIEKGKEIKLAH